MMLQKVVDVGTMLAAFADGMTQWRNHGPPAPQSLPLTTEEMELAENFNKSEMRGIRDSSDYDNTTNLVITTTCAALLSPMRFGLGPIIPPSPKKIPNHRDRLRTDTRDNFLQPGNSANKPCNQSYDCSEIDEEINKVRNCQTMSCSYCPNTVHLTTKVFNQLCLDMDQAHTLNHLGKPRCIDVDSYKIYNTLHTQEHDPDLSTLKLSENSLENLVQVDYRCPKCRNCQSCRDAHQTERVSLREEQEDALIKDCVTLDYENQRFLCSLPLRGKAEDFLVTNKRDAQKVLDRLVLLYQKEEATKELMARAATASMTSWPKGKARALTSSRCSLGSLSAPLAFWVTSPSSTMSSN